MTRLRMWVGKLVRVSAREPMWRGASWDKERLTAKAEASGDSPPTLGAQIGAQHSNCHPGLATMLEKREGNRSPTASCQHPLPRHALVAVQGSGPLVFPWPVCLPSLEPCLEFPPCPPVAAPRHHHSGQQGSRAGGVGVHGWSSS